MRQVIVTLFAAILVILTGVGAEAFFGNPPKKSLPEQRVIIDNAPKLYVVVKLLPGEMSDFNYDKGVFVDLNSYPFEDKKMYIDVYLFLGNGTYVDYNLDFYSGLLTPGDPHNMNDSNWNRFLNLYAFNPSGDFDVCTLKEWRRSTKSYRWADIETKWVWVEQIPPHFKLYVPVCRGIEPFFTGLYLPQNLTTFPYSDPLNPAGYGYIRIGRFYMAEDRHREGCDTDGDGYIDDLCFQYGDYPGGNYIFYFILTEAGTTNIVKWIEVPFCAGFCDE